MQALKKWRHYLLPKEFVLFTNHYALQFINSQGKLNQRHVRWIEYLQSYSFILEHSSGTSNRIANALSRSCVLLAELRVQVSGFDAMRGLYKED